MPKAPSLSRKWLSSPSQRFHGPPRSESQALLRKAFFAFAAHSQGGLSPGCPLHPRSQSGGQGRAPGRAGGRRRLAAGGLWPPACQTKWLGRGTLAPAPAICGRFAPCRRPPRLANRQTPMRAGAAGPALCALRPPYSSGQTYRPLPLVFSPYWMAWTGQRLMQLVQR